MDQIDQKIDVVAVNFTRGKAIKVNNSPYVYNIVEKVSLEWPDTDDLDVIFKAFNDYLDTFCHFGKAKVLILCNPPRRFLVTMWHKSLAFYRFKYKIDVKVLIHEGDSAIYTLP